MSNTIWDQHQCAAHIRTILAAARPTRTGRVFMSAYQISIEFEKRFPSEFAAIGKSIGGTGTGPTSLPQYLAGQLAERILRYGTIQDIEIAYLDLAYTRTIEYAANGQSVDVSGTDGNSALAVFRLREGEDS